jgi:hypothetical protein
MHNYCNDPKVEVDVLNACKRAFCGQSNVEGSPPRQQRQQQPDNEPGARRAPAGNAEPEPQRALLDMSSYSPMSIGAS